MRVIAFVGPSGTGKSYRSVMVSQQYGADAIIDDGLLISHGKVIAGTSAKKEPTKIASVKHALFMNPSQVNEIKKVLKRNKIKCLMILGTSDGMVNKIAKNIGVHEVEQIIRIEDDCNTRRNEYGHLECVQLKGNTLFLFRHLK